MEILKQLIQLDREANVPIYLQVTNAFIHGIRHGQIRKGLKLPSSRAMAEMLKVNRMTMVAAYDELMSQGWIEMLHRKGTFVKKELPLLAPRKIGTSLEAFAFPEKTYFPFDEKRVVPYPVSDFPPEGKLIFNDGFPDSRLAPIELLTRNMRSLSRLSSHKKYLMYGGAQGTMMLRETLSNFLSDTRGLPITPENILITRGATMAIYLATNILLSQGDEMIVGSPGYPGANFIFQQAKAHLNYVPVDEDGIDVDAIEKVCQRKQIKMVFVIPHHHNPTTVTLTPERRIRLLELAVKYKFAIIEDDYDYDFHYASKPMMPMASLDRHGSVIYIGTLTKTLAPAIRTGFMVGPKNFIHAATRLRKVIDTQGDSLIENAIAQFYKDGSMARHIKKSVKLYKERRDHFCDLLSSELGHHVSFQIPDGGMSVWTKFEKASLPKIAELSMNKNLIIDNGVKYNTTKNNFNSTRLGFASLNFNEQKRAIEILRQCIQEARRS